MIVQYGNDEVLCRVRRNPTLIGRVRIHIYPSGEVEIEAPEGETDGQVRLAAQRRARWIFRHRNTVLASRKEATPREFVSGETHFYLGRRYKLVVHETSDRPSEVKLLRGRLEVTLPVADPAAVKRRLGVWYSVRASEYLAAKHDTIAAKIPWIETPPPLKLRRMRTQWGSCSPEGVIYLNPALIRVPRHCIEYVIFHELCHLQEHNHSKRFYDLLDRNVSRWRSTKNELDDLAELVLAIEF